MFCPGTDMLLWKYESSKIRGDQNWKILNCWTNNSTSAAELVKGSREIATPDYKRNLLFLKNLMFGKRES